MTPEKPKLSEKSVTLLLTLESQGQQRKVRTRHVDENATETAGKAVHGAVATDAEARKVSAAKKILDCPEAKAIRKFDGRTRKHLTEIALPGPFKRNFYTVAYGNLDEVYEYLEGRKKERSELVEAFVAVLDTVVAEDEKTLGSLHADVDYPSADELREAFAMDYQIVALEAPEGGSELHHAIFEREKMKLEGRFQVAGEVIVAALRLAAKKHFDYLVSVLVDNPDGKKKRIHQASIDKLHKFLDGFKDRNIQNDTELEALVNEAKDLVAGVTKKDLKESTDIRAALQKAMVPVQAKINLLVENAPKRALHFGDFDDDKSEDAHAAA